MNALAILGLDAVDYDHPTWDSAPVFNEAEWAALLAPATVTVLAYDETLALAVEADETAAGWLAQDFE